MFRKGIVFAALLMCVPAVAQAQAEAGDWEITLGANAANGPDFDGFAGGKDSYDAFMADVGCIVMGGDTYAWLRKHEPGSWPYPAEHVAGGIAPGYAALAGRSIKGTRPTLPMA